MDARSSKVLLLRSLCYIVDYNAKDLRQFIINTRKNTFYILRPITTNFYID